MRSQGKIVPWPKLLSYYSFLSSIKGIKGFNFIDPACLFNVVNNFMCVRVCVCSSFLEVWGEPELYYQFKFIYNSHNVNDTSE